MCLSWPRPYDAAALVDARGPLNHTSEYPCKLQTYALSGDDHLATNTLRVDTPYALSFHPTAAVHHGGACQLSLTLDAAPTNASVFKVFHTILGGCPGVDNDFDARNQTFALPAGAVPAGPAVLALSWWPVASGAPEMYMNCAPVEVVGGLDRGSPAMDAFWALPDALVANLGVGDEGGVGVVEQEEVGRRQWDLIAGEGRMPRCRRRQGAGGNWNAILKVPSPGRSVAYGENPYGWPLVAPEGECGVWGVGPEGYWEVGGEEGGLFAEPVKVLGVVGLVGGMVCLFSF
ncbi:chitin-binding domain 3 protein [Neofusicoccum parvum]|nr:chitin-binding domain 3 protein [Neofusicoccum parvum]